MRNRCENIDFLINLLRKQFIFHAINQVDFGADDNSQYSEYSQDQRYYEDENQEQFYDEIDPEAHYDDVGEFSAGQDDDYYDDEEDEQFNL